MKDNNDTNIVHSSIFQNLNVIHKSSKNILTIESVKLNTFNTISHNLFYMHSFTIRNFHPHPPPQKK